MNDTDSHQEFNMECFLGCMNYADIHTLCIKTNDPKVMDAIFKMAHRNVAFYNQLMVNVNASEEMVMKCLCALLQTKQRIFLHGLVRERLPEEFFREIFANYKNVYDIHFAIRHLSCPVDMLDKVSKRSNKFLDLYCAVAENPNTTKKILKRILRKADENVELYPILYDRVMSHPNFPVELRVQYMLEQ